MDLGRSTRILLIEDNRADAGLVRAALAETPSARFELIHVERLADGVAALRQQPFDVVLLDLSLPDAQGLQTIRSVAQAAPQMPLLVLTGLDDDTIALQAMQEGAQDYLAKGRLDGPLLARAIRYSIERKRLLAQEREARTAAEQAERRSAFLAEAAAVLTASLEPQETLRNVARLAVPRIADVCVVDLVAGDGRIQRLEIAHVDPRQEAQLRSLLERFPSPPSETNPIRETLRSGESRLLPEISDSLVQSLAQSPEHLQMLRALQARSAMVVPLSARGQTLGALTFVRVRQSPPFTTSDLALAEDLARRAASAVDNARLYSLVVESDRRKDELLAMLAHELRNPLSAISNASHVLDRKLGSDPASVSERAIISRQAAHLSRLINDLLAVSRLTQGKIELSREPLELQSVVREALDTVRPLIEGRGLELHVSLPAEPIRLQADRVRLEQMVFNLLHNALKYTEAGGHIWLEAEASGAEAVLRFRDTGVGIPQSLLPRIFDLFVQADQALDRSQGGLGIGLTLVRSVVELHGGSVSAHSAGPGRGSEFVVRLPALAPREEPKAPAEPEPSRPRSLRVLIVEDNPDAAESLASLIELWGHDVRMALDGPQGLDLAEGFRPDIALLDIGLPGMDGYEVARHLRRNSKLGPLRLIAVTGYGQEDDRRRSAEAGFDRHLTKPVDPAVLRELLES